MVIPHIQRELCFQILLTTGCHQSKCPGSHPTVPICQSLGLPEERDTLGLHVKQDVQVSVLSDSQHSVGPKHLRDAHTEEALAVASWHAEFTEGPALWACSFWFPWCWMELRLPVCQVSAAPLGHTSLPCTLIS